MYASSVVRRKTKRRAASALAGPRFVDSSGRCKIRAMDGFWRHAAPWHRLQF